MLSGVIRQTGRVSLLIRRLQVRVLPGAVPAAANRRDNGLPGATLDTSAALTAVVGMLPGRPVVWVPVAIGGLGVCRSAPTLADRRGRWPSGRRLRPGSAGWCPCS